MKKRQDWNSHLHGCFMKGWNCAKQGGSANDCPYMSGESGGTGISSHGGNLQAQRRRMWHEGFVKNLEAAAELYHQEGCGMNTTNDLPPETLQRLIDFAHAAMRKREGYPGDYPINQSRSVEGCAPIYAKDWREVMKLGKPSWEVGT